MNPWEAWRRRRRLRAEDAALAPEVEAARIEAPNPAAGVLLATIVLFFVAALGWAHFAQLDEVTHGRGRIIPSSEVQVIQHLEGGILKSIQVAEGEVVAAGQVLLQVDNTSAASRLGELEARYHTLLAQIARLQAEAEEGEILFPDELQRLAPEVAADERRLFDARQAELRTQLQILRDQGRQRGHELEELHGKRQELEERLRLAREELKMIRPLAEQRIVPQVNLLKLKRELNAIEGEIATNRAAIARTQAARDEAEQRIEERMLTFLSGARDELAAHRAELAGVRQTLAAERDRVQRTEVRSPVMGIVKELKLRTLGGVIRPGQELAEVVPLEDTLLVEAQIRPADIAFLRPGQPATVKVSAYDFTVYGGLRGTLERISADTIVDGQGEANYKIIIRTERNTLPFGDRELPIMPGMVVTADVLTGRKSVLEYLLKPILRARELALRER